MRPSNLLHRRYDFKVNFFRVFFKNILMIYRGQLRAEKQRNIFSIFQSVCGKFQS